MNRTLIIAEAGVNHNGNLEMAHKLIDEAKKANADIVKFQTAKPEMVVSKYAEKAAYQKVTTDADESQLDMIKKTSLSLRSIVKMSKSGSCRRRSISMRCIFLSMIAASIRSKSLRVRSPMRRFCWKQPAPARKLSCRRA